MSNNITLKNPMRGKSKKTVIIADAISGIETAILSEIQNGAAVPHQRILSRQKLARLLGASPYQIRQAALVEEHPEWLSVNRAVLERQKASSPYPKGSVLYEYDPRSVQNQTYPHTSFCLHRPHMETVAAKFYLGIQSLEETMAKMTAGWVNT